MTALVVASAVPSVFLFLGVLSACVIAAAVYFERPKVLSLVLAFVGTGTLIAQSPKPDSPIYCSCPVIQCLTIGCWPSAHSTTVETPWIRR